MSESQEKKIIELENRLAAIEAAMPMINRNIIRIVSWREKSDKRLDGFQDTQDRFGARLKTFKETYKQVTARLSAFTPHKVEYFLSSMKSRSEMLTATLKVFSLKFAVSSTMRYALIDQPELQFAALKGANLLMDGQSDAWWLDKEDCDVDWWIASAIKADANYEPQATILVGAA